MTLTKTMGTTGSTIYNFSRKLILRYNVENRSMKFLDKEKLPRAPRHPLTLQKPAKDFALSEEELKELHGKNEKLNEYLKKVYLTSTLKIIETPSKRPKPKKENEIFKTKMFLGPEKAEPGYCTLSNILKILTTCQEKPDTSNASGIAMQYNLNKQDVVQLTTFYSLCVKEDYKFMHRKPKDHEEETEEIHSKTFGEFRRIVKQITAK